MMADIEDPPRPRWPGVLIGLLVTAPLGLGLAFLFLPSLYGQIMGGVGAFDAQLRVDDDYMKTLCVEALDVDRDEQLCNCALAAEFPSLDCQIQFSIWRTLEHARRCEDDTIAEASVGFCACVTTLAERIESADEPRQARVAGQKFSACTQLEDAQPRPSLASLASGS